MAIEGNLQDMDLPALLQFVSQSNSPTCIQIEEGQKRAVIFIHGRIVNHAELIQRTEGQNTRHGGEEAFYKILGWEEGQFSVRRNAMAPQDTINMEWEFLLMEGLRRLDESRTTPETARVSDDEPVESLSDMLADLSSDDAEALRQLIQENIDMTNINQALDQIMAIDGALAAAIVDWESGLTLGTIGNGIDIELAAAGNTNVVRSKLAVMKDLEIDGKIEDILITLSTQYHLIRLLHGETNIFIYVALDGKKSNLGLARHRLIKIEKELAI